MKLEEELLAVYREKPCRTLPNAFWKTAARVDGMVLDILYGSGGQLSTLAVWQDDACLAYWCEDPSGQAVASSRLAQCDYALVHASCLAVVPGETFSQRRPYFRLRHAGPVQQFDPPLGFFIRNAQPEAEIDEIAWFIQRCYADIKVNTEIVRQWLDHPAYDPGLWIWVIDSSTGNAAGLGIAERDKNVPEASLEWIQVLPENHGRGLGTMLVAELLHFSAGKVDFTTVSGEWDHPDQPERLYRKCGFCGSDVWWFLAK